MSSMMRRAIELSSFRPSLAGPETRKVLNYFTSLHPEFQSLSFETGQKVYDWTVPPEWNLKRAYLRHLESGSIYADSDKSPLSVVIYSEPVHRVVRKSDLQDKLHYNKLLPSAIPYLTSYYKRTWGFCLSYDEFCSMPDGDYEAFIDSEFIEGSLDLIHAVFPGKSQTEVLFTSYICHPQMANNEISGPVLLSEIMDYIKSLNGHHYYTYRFVLGPETIGSICYLSRFYDHLKSHLLTGYCLTCIGDSGPHSTVCGPSKESIANISAIASTVGFSESNTYSFLDRGSDERQYCSPNIDLDFCTLTRSKWASYPEYHTSLDNISLLSESNFSASFDRVKSIITTLENGCLVSTDIKCEPFLSRHGLYRTLSTPEHSKYDRQISNLLAYARDRSSLFQLSIDLNIPLSIIDNLSQMLASHHLLTRDFIDPYSQ